MAESGKSAVVNQPQTATSVVSICINLWFIDHKRYTSLAGRYARLGNPGIMLFIYNPAATVKAGGIYL